MANFTAADIKALREKTGAGMLDVKKALDEANGDATKAEEILRVKGLKSVAKREGRTASDGLIASAVIDTDNGQRGVLVEVNSETDFVAKNEKFISMADKILNAAVAASAETVEEVLNASTDEGSVKELLEANSAIIGEKLDVTHISVVTGEHVEAYMHRTNPDLPPQVGVLVASDKAASSVAHDIAVHIAALNPAYLDRNSVPADVVAAEERVATETTIAEGKPEAAVPNIVKGRMNGFYKQVCLLEQGYAREPKTPVGDVVKQTGGLITDFARIRVGASE
ncbi:MAG: elongation factor Ts [Actinomycetaceae bacterium]|nr:elongation factor Ts [Actinomycetaceae bacterium]